MAYSSVRGQEEAEFIGDNLFRDNQFGVSNHLFDVCLLITNTPSEWVCYDSPYETGDCNEEIYEGTLTDLDDQYTYALRIYPQSVCDHSDYINGVTTGDLVDIVKHYRNITSLTDPFQLVSADATGDHVIDTNDVISIRNAILGVTTGFMDGSNPGRTSWEWFNADDIADNQMDFESDPWNYTINEQWPGAPDPGIIFGGLSVDDLQNSSNIPIWFDYRTTKIGDIFSYSVYSSTNTWVCGTYDLKQNELEKRADHPRINTSEIPNIDIKKGTTLDLIIKIDANQDISSIQIPVYLNKNDFKLLNVTTSFEQSTFWNHDLINSQFISIWYNALLPGKLVNGSTFLKIKLEAINDVKGLNRYFSNVAISPLELLDSKGQAINAIIYLYIESIEPKELDVKMTFNGSINFDILSIFDDNAIIEIYGLNGALFDRFERKINKGYNNLIISSGNSKGLFIVMVKVGALHYYFKYINN